MYEDRKQRYSVELPVLLVFYHSGSKNERGRICIKRQKNYRRFKMRLTLIRWNQRKIGHPG